MASGFCLAKLLRLLLPLHPVVISLYMQRCLTALPLVNLSTVISVLLSIVSIINRTKLMSRAFETICGYFEECTEAIMPTLYILHRGLAALNSADNLTMPFNAPDASRTAMIISSHTIHFQNIKDVTLDAYSHSLVTVHKLTFDNPLFDISDNKIIHSDSRNLEPNWSFVKHPLNSWNVRSTLTLLKYVISTPELFAKFGYYNAQGDIVWKPGVCYQYMWEFFELNMDMFVAMVLSAREPGWASELVSNLLANISGSSICNALVLFNLFALRGTFNKTSFTTSSDKSMVRIPLIPVG
jgi:hypothetical protein